MAIPPAPLNVPAASVPPRTALLTNITEQTSLLHQLFTVLANPAPNAQSTNPPGVAIPSLYADLQARTKELESITEGLWEHQRAWAEMKKKEGEVRALESQVKELISELEGGRRELEGLIQDGQEEEEDSDVEDKRHEGSKTNKISVPVLLSHARSLARHSSAPTSSHLSLGDKSQFQPWPTETAMRKGILFMEGGSMGTIGEIERHQPGQVVMGGQQDVQIEEVVEEQRPRGPAPVFDLDLNSDSDEDV